MNKDKINIKNFFKNDFYNEILVPIHKAGYPFIFIFFVFSLFLGALSDFLGWIGLILTAWCVYFFRDPIRVIPKDKNLIISPADGKVLKVSVENPPEEFNSKRKLNKLSIFMNVFNVHVNRIPFSGTISELKYIPGTFFNASLDKSSKENERMCIKLEISKNKYIYLVQIAGLIARRIKCDLEKNQKVETGEKFGIIRFGSRVDIYVPEEIKFSVVEGQTLIGGESIVAQIRDV